MSGGIFGDDDELLDEEEKDEEEEEEETDEEDEEESESPILDVTEEQREHAQKRLNSGEMLFPEEEEDFKKRVKKPKGDRAHRVVAKVDQDILDEVGDALGDFDAETANKKQIRTLRKALQHLSLARYPKKKREKKDKSERLAKLKMSKQEVPAKKVVKKLLKKRK